MSLLEEMTLLLMSLEKGKKVTMTSMCLIRLKSKKSSISMMTILTKLEQSKLIKTWNPERRVSLLLRMLTLM
jgi:hypothetical protein